MRPKGPDLSGRTFGRWTVIRENQKIGKDRYWMCRCSCGNICSVIQYSLMSGGTTKCLKCAKEHHFFRPDLIGKVFGYLTVIEDLPDIIRISKKNPKIKRSDRVLKCLCVCGAETTSFGNNLTSGMKRSCGCRRFTHRRKLVQGDPPIVD
jgi:hypothetical protein